MADARKFKKLTNLIQKLSKYLACTEHITTMAEALTQ